MNWKSDLQLADLDACTRLEITCRVCALVRYEEAGTLLGRAEFRYAYLDEVERHLKCARRGCRGDVRLALIHDDKTEGFVGGMA